MAEVKKTALAKPEPVLIPASESSDPTVQYLLAQRQALSVQDESHAADIEAARAEIEARVEVHAAIAADLAKLGYK